MADVFRDTREQSMAQSFDRNISVTANAGSGKTTILKKRFVNIALHHGKEFDPRRVVAITFTRKAASEIFAKIAEEFDKRIENSKESKLHKLLFDIRTHLKSANISTIHSFCSSLLRDFPIEAGVSPNFIELNEADKLKLVNDAITEVLSDKLSNPEFDNKKYRSLLTTFGKNNVESHIKIILSKIEILEKLNTIYSKSNQEIIDFVVNDFISNFINELKPLLKDFIDASKQMELVTHKKGHEIIWSLVTKSCEEINNIFLHSEEISKDDLESIINDIMSQKVLLETDKIITKTNKINGSTYHSKTYSIPERVNQKIEIFFGHLQKYDLLASINNLSSNIDFARTFLEIAQSVIEYINIEKDVNNYLDFDDLLLLTNKMLKDDETCEKVRNRFDYIMIDEFQDTNDVQYDIVKSLIPELKDNTTDSGINLFIVGDPKQSIYGFRNADVRVFNKAIDDIKEVNKYLLTQQKINNHIMDTNQQIIQCSDEEINGNMELSVSFRHKPVISSFTNYICRCIMNVQESEYDVSYSDLICSKSFEKFSNLDDDGKMALDDKFGSVSFITVDEKDEKKTESGELIEKDNEFELLAKHIKNIVEHNELNNKYYYKDIAILGRTKKHFNQLALAFQENHIPYILQSGKGFFDTQEISDLLSVLKFLHNTKDDLALVAALHSPFFGIQNELFTTLKHLYPKQNYWDKILKYLEENTDELLLRAKNILCNLIDYSTKLSISHLLQQVIEFTAYDGSIMKTQGQSQIKANIEKFIQMAREFENRGFKNLFDFVEEINFISSESTTEGEAVILTEADAVNIMTIHASKGLEFPIIALIDTTGGTQNTSGFIIDDKFGLGFKTPEYDDTYDVFENQDNLIYYTIKDRSAKRERAELKRLIYVALTRAQDHIIICGTNKKNNRYPSSMMAMILESLNMDMTSLLTTASIPIRDNLKFYHLNIITDINIGFNIRNHVKIELSATDTLEQIINIDNRKIEFLFGDINPLRANEYFSASRFMSFEKDFNKYISRYVLGFSDSADYRYSLEDEQTEYGGTLAGSFIHNVMEKIDGWIDEKSNLIENSLNETINSILEIYRIKDDQTYFEQTKNQIINVMNTTLIQKNKNFLKNSKKEFTVNIPFQNDFLMAQIDLLLIKEKDEIEIWDWKSNNVSTKEIMHQSAAGYKTQMLVYAYIISFLYPNLDKITTRLLYTQMANKSSNDDDWTVMNSWTKTELQEFGELIKTRIELMKKKLTINNSQNI